MHKKKQTLAHVLHQKLNAPPDAQKENTCSLSNEPLLAAHNLTATQPSLGPTELGHHLCDDRAHLGIRLVLSKVGRIVHHWNQALKQWVKSMMCTLILYSQVKQAGEMTQLCL